FSVGASKSFLITNIFYAHNRFVASLAIYDCSKGTVADGQRFGGNSFPLQQHVKHRYLRAKATTTDDTSKTTLPMFLFALQTFDFV
ncbi:unnamed protein product, partial [Ceratitis capitata]